MRIIATAIVIAIAATSAGCGGSSSSSSRAPAQTVAQTVPQTTAAPTKTTAAPTKPTSGRGRGAKTVPTHLVGRPPTVPTHLVGRPLDVAESMLRNVGISYKLIPLHGHAKGAATHWGVCETKTVEEPGVTSGRSVDLIVAPLKCGAR